MNKRGNESLYYIHGYLSGPDGSKALLLKEELGVVPLKYRDCEPEDLVIASCLSEIKKHISSDTSPILIGSSLGGFLAVEIAYDVDVSKLFLLNPAVIPPEVSIDTIPDMPLSILQDMKDKRLFTEKIDAEIIVFSAINDTVVPPDWVLRFTQFQEATVKFFHDDHRFTHHLPALPFLIKSFL